VTSPNTDLLVRQAGQGPAALVLHGGPGPGSVTPLVDHLARDHHVYAPTHPGWDDTTRPAELDSVPALARRYRQLIAELGLTDVIVAGTSFGGWVAAELLAQTAAEQSTVVGRLVLIDSAGFDIPGHPLRMPGTRNGQGPPGNAMAALAAYAGGRLTDPSLLPRLAVAGTPTLVVWGERDVVTPPAYGRAVAAALPGSTFVSVPDAGHVPFRESPEAVWAALDRFLRAGEAAR
jgi:pimeloyl-ACP methyl ester carboxylesterase